MTSCVGDGKGFFNADKKIPRELKGWVASARKTKLPWFVAVAVSNSRAKQMMTSLRIILSVINIYNQAYNTYMHFIGKKNKY